MNANDFSQPELKTIYYSLLIRMSEMEKIIKNTHCYNSDYIAESYQAYSECSAIVSQIKPKIIF